MAASIVFSVLAAMFLFSGGFVFAAAGHFRQDDGKLAGNLALIAMVFVAIGAMLLTLRGVA